jgi:hypothetical protein
MYTSEVYDGWLVQHDQCSSNVVNKVLIKAVVNQ